MTQVTAKKSYIKDGDGNYVVPYVNPASTTDLGVVKVDGESITITNGVISASGGSAAVDTSVIDKALNEKQNALTAGEGVKFGYKLTDTQQVAPTCMAYGNGVFLGVSHGTKSKGYPSSVYRWNFDPDDFTWSTKEEISTLSGYRWEDMCFDGKRFVLLSYDGYISTSEDSYEWTEPESVLEDDTYAQILYSNGHYLAIDEDTNRLAYTDNAGFEAGEWEYAEVFSEDDVYYFEPNRNGFVALRNDGYVTFSSTGAVWTTPEQVITLGAEQDIEGLVYTGDRYIATVHVSTDTYRWLSSRDCKTWADIDIDIPDEDSVFPLARVINASSQLFFDLSGELYTAEETITAESGVFVATYGTTTYAEVLAAYEAGKAVFVKPVKVNFTNFAQLVKQATAGSNNEMSFIFSSVDNSDRTGWGQPNISYAYLTISNVWGSYQNIPLENTQNRVSSLYYGSTNTQYPSAKCVYDALKTKQDVLTAGDGITISGNTISSNAGIPIIYEV